MSEVNVINEVTEDVVENVTEACTTSKLSPIAKIVVAMLVAGGTVTAVVAHKKGGFKKLFSKKDEDVVDVVDVVEKTTEADEK